MTEDASEIQRSERGNEVTVIRADGRTPHLEEESSRQARGREPAGFGSWLRRLLRCETDEQCRSVQRGSVWVKRLGKWAMLFSIGLTLFVSDLIAAMVDTLQRYEAPTTTFFYRWTVGWFTDVPSGGASLIAVWKVVDLIQFVFFAGLVLVTVRWSYADCRVADGRFVSFKRLAIYSLATNVLIYFGLRLLAGSAGVEL